MKRKVLFTLRHSSVETRPNRLANHLSEHVLVSFPLLELGFNPFSFQILTIFSCIDAKYGLLLIQIIAML